MLNNQVSTIQLTTDAVVNKSKHSAYLALLADPVVNDVNKASDLLNTMLKLQNKYLNYLK